ncbi:MAG: hypothetical protein HQL19_06535 [Candidatus Omnitrophica bacterium]|nr:hypothetical protein [Candidatus Omnitrophota bacterium]
MSEIICPQCKNPIYDEEALSCHFCGHSLNQRSSGLLGKMRGAGMKWVLITIGIIMAVVMIATMF